MGTMSERPSSAAMPARWAQSPWRCRLTHSPDQHPGSFDGERLARIEQPAVAERIAFERDDPALPVVKRVAMGVSEPEGTVDESEIFIGREMLRQLRGIGSRSSGRDALVEM